KDDVGLPERDIGLEDADDFEEVERPAGDRNAAGGGADLETQASRQLGADDDLARLPRLVGAVKRAVDASHGIRQLVPRDADDYGVNVILAQSDGADDPRRDFGYALYLLDLFDGFEGDRHVAAELVAGHIEIRARVDTRLRLLLNSFGQSQPNQER